MTLPLVLISLLWLVMILNNVNEKYFLNVLYKILNLLACPVLFKMTPWRCALSYCLLLLLPALVILALNR